MPEVLGHMSHMTYVRLGAWHLTQVYAALLHELHM